MATIQKRKGSYLISVSTGYDINGKQIRRTMTYKPDEALTPRKLEKELNRQAALFEERVKSGQYVDCDIKFADFADKWFDEYANSQLSPTTLHRYRGCMERINASVGHIKLSRLQPLHLNAFYKNLQEIGIREDVKFTITKDITPVLKDRRLKLYELAEMADISNSTLRNAIKGMNVSKHTAEKICSALKVPVKEYFSVTEQKPLENSTIQYYHHVISSILSTAVQWQVISANPCDRIKPPKAEKKEADYLDEIEALRMLDCLEAEPILYRTLFTLILQTGMRRGEALGLTWNDIDIDRGIIDINKSSLYLPDKGVFEHDTKTKSSHRIISIPTEAVNILKSFKAYQSKE